ncbi:MAG: hypothetical protein AB1403_09040, partial [Candidatus Riflebacteria bacterium]
MPVKKILALLLLLFFVSQSLQADDEKLLIEKSKLLTQKGQKAEERGELEEAVSCYEDAYNAYPKNILPLLLWGKALYRVGMYSRADEVLEKIPVEKLPDNGKAEVFLLQGRIAIANEKLEDAAAAFSRAVKAAPANQKARVRLALVNQMLGMSNRADELLMDFEHSGALPVRELVISLLADLQLGNLGRAHNACSELSRFMVDANYPDEQPPALLGLWKIAPLCLIASFPLALGNIFAVIYYLILFSALMFLASRLSPPTAVWHDLLFVAGTVFLMIAV